MTIVSIFQHNYLHIGPAIVIKKQNAGNKNITNTSNLYGINNIPLQILKHRLSLWRFLTRSLFSS